MIDELFGDSGALDAARLVRPDGEVEESIARAAWTVFAEPGDAVAGELIAALGARDALTFIGRGRVAASHVDPSMFGDRGPGALSEGLARWVPRVEPRAVLQALRSAAEVGARLVVPGDAHWPVSLDDLGASAPSALWVRGRVETLTRAPRVSVVGARASSGYGDHVAAELAGDLAAAGAVIVSGGAYGIDGAAHRAALGVDGLTIAFLAGGVDRAYPAGHQQLLRRIVDTGAVVSEPPCGTAPTKWRFLARNRLIAALGQATVVVEAGWRSGSLNTAGHAAALGRPLGAVPGPVTSPSSAGCHRLLREYDARCVTSAAEVRELWGEQSHVASDERPVDPDTTRLLDSVGSRSPASVGELARRSGLSEARVRSLLGILELEGEVRRTSDGWSRAPGSRSG